MKLDSDEGKQLPSVTSSEAMIAEKAPSALVYLQRVRCSDLIEILGLRPYVGRGVMPGEAAQEQERRIAKKYKRITGAEPVGLVDTLRILTGPDMKEDLLEYLRERGVTPKPKETRE